MAAAKTYSDKIVSNNSDLVGICFFGTASLIIIIFFSSNFALLYLVQTKKLMVQKIIWGGKKKREKKNPYDFQNIYLFQDLDVPDAQRIKEIERLICK